MADDDGSAEAPLVDVGVRSMRLRVILLGLVVIGAMSAVAVVSALTGDDDGGSDDAAPPPVFARIELEAETVAAGARLDGQVVVVNNTGEDIEVIGCGSIFQVALANQDVEPEPAWTLCAQELTIPTGESRYPVTVVAHHLSCSSGPSAEPVIPCNGGGRPPALPPGEYEARLYQSSEVVPEPPPAEVFVVP